MMSEPEILQVTGLAPTPRLDIGIASFGRGGCAVS
jgi:hypothetical protein